jgi:hypothetical protein
MDGWMDEIAATSWVVPNLLLYPHPCCCCTIIIILCKSKFDELAKWMDG